MNSNPVFGVVMLMIEKLQYYQNPLVLVDEAMQELHRQPYGVRLTLAISATHVPNIARVKHASYVRMYVYACICIYVCVNTWLSIYRLTYWAVQSAQTALGSYSGLEWLVPISDGAKAAPLPLNSASVGQKGSKLPLRGTNYRKRSRTTWKAPLNLRRALVRVGKNVGCIALGAALGFEELSLCRHAHKP